MSVGGVADGSADPAEGHPVAVIGHALFCPQVRGSGGLAVNTLLLSCSQCDCQLIYGAHSAPPRSLYLPGANPTDWPRRVNHSRIALPGCTAPLIGRRRPRRGRGRERTGRRAARGDAHHHRHGQLRGERGRRRQRRRRRAKNPQSRHASPCSFLALPSPSGPPLHSYSHRRPPPPPPLPLPSAPPRRFRALPRARHLQRPPHAAGGAHPEPQLQRPRRGPAAR